MEFGIHSSFFFLFFIFFALISSIDFEVLISCSQPVLFLKFGCRPVFVPLFPIIHQRVLYQPRPNLCEPPQDHHL
ncbi:hypothetical protein N665_0218s0095 [Sinapis alba]|nr:hypothetical protein N665_0218s0095 [Sinapis alba]